MVAWNQADYIEMAACDEPVSQKPSFFDHLTRLIRRAENLSNSRRKSDLAEGGFWDALTGFTWGLPWQASTASLISASLLLIASGSERWFSTGPQRSCSLRHVPSALRPVGAAGRAAYRYVGHEA